MTDDWISTLLSPAFVTFKEQTSILRTKHPQLHECLETCDLVGLTASLDQAISIIPTPEYPEAASKIKEFHARYGWVNTQLSDGGLVKGVPQVSFDSNPSSDGRLKDHQLFGESYLVLWLCPFDIERIREHLQSQIANLARNRNASPSFCQFEERRNLYQSPNYTFRNQSKLTKEYFQQEFIERLCIQESVEEDAFAGIKKILQKNIDEEV